MPTFNGPYRDPEDGRAARRCRTPKALARIRRGLPREHLLEAFRSVFDREPTDDEELEAFADHCARELYNSGADEIGP